MVMLTRLVFAMQLVAFITAAAPASDSRADEPGAVVIIKAARLIDGRGGEPVSPAMIRVEGGKIAEAGQSVQTPAGARIIDLGSATLLPGLIDLHTHLTNRMGVHWEDGLTTTTPGHDALWRSEEHTSELQSH